MKLNLDKFYIIVDGSNIAFYKRTHKKKAKYNNLKIAIDYLESLKKLYPIECEIIVDASLRHHIDDPTNLEESIKTGKILQSPNKAEADKFFLQFYNLYPSRTIIISNDNFEDHSISNLTICKFVIMFDKIITLPDLEELLISKVEHKKEAEINV